MEYGKDEVSVVHGRGVEIRDTCFFEGAWDGPFGDEKFDAAPMFVGSGARLDHRGVLFVAPTVMNAYLFSVRRGNRLLISNSLVFLLARTGDEPDPQYPHYYYDLLEISRRGFSKAPPALTMRSGSEISILFFHNYLIRPDLSLQFQENGSREAPGTFQGYFRLLDDTVRLMFSNAGDPRRRWCFRPITTISQGYDSTAAAALAARSGCSEALTLLGRGERGKLVAERLGLAVTEYQFTDFLKLPGTPEAEFCAMPLGSNVPLAVMEPQLRGKLLTTGYMGDDIWRRNKRILSNLRYPQHPYLREHSLLEFRLRVGFLTLPVSQIGLAHISAVQRISRSREMKPWSVGGWYDGPIPRRILLEAGVPHNLFGVSKIGGAHCYPQEANGMSNSSRKDFMAFCQDQSVSLVELEVGPLIRILSRCHSYICRFLAKLPAWLGFFYLPFTRLRLRNKTHFLAGIQMYTFHWGVARIRHRYEIPPAQGMPQP
ncbi:hypothetical protein ACFLRM_03960 [Acidobacteriota bacterium]